MTYLVQATYRPGGADARLAIRAEHIRYMLDWLPRTVFGGALLADEAGGGATGMAVALDVASREDATAFVDGEPYARAGLFDDIRIVAMRQMTPPHDAAFLERELAASLRHPSA